MVSKEIVLSVESYCNEHQVSRHSRLKELNLPTSQYYLVRPSITLKTAIFVVFFNINQIVMSYIETNLQPGEEIKYRAKIHFFLFVQPTILLLIGAFMASAPKEISAMTHYAGLLILFFGVVSLVQRLLIKIGSDYAVTNKRVILKTGIISRRAVDLILAKCVGLHIKQSIMGRIFNFGTITVTTGGVTSSYPFIADPLAFRREINTQIG